MAIPLKEGTHINVERKVFEPGYDMPSMEMAMDHYDIGYVISGERSIITPLGTYNYGKGMVAGSPPFVYGRTVARSQDKYERVLIKFTPEYIEPFVKEVGQQIFDGIYEKKRVFRFSEEGRIKIEKMFLDMVEEFEKNSLHKEFILQGMLFRLLLTIWEEQLPEEGVEQHPTPLTPPIMDVISFVENEYYRSPSLEEAAQVANFSPAYFSRIFHKQMGKSYSEYLNNVKLRHVQILLTQTDKSVMEIAQETGYCHGNYLNELFKKKFGMTPGKYRKKNL